MASRSPRLLPAGRHRGEHLRCRQNERFVVVLTVQQDNPWPARVILTDLLPGGFEIDNPSLVDSARLANFDWIDAVEPAHAEFRNDRFVAAFDRDRARRQLFGGLCRARGHTGHL